MKKTLITLAALAASVASAATIEDATVNTTDIKTTINAPSTSASYTLIAAMDWDTAITKLGQYNAGDQSNYGYIYGGNGSDKSVAKGFALIRGDSGSNPDNIYSFICTWKDSITAVNAAGGKNTNLTMSNDGGTFVFDRATYENAGRLVLSLTYDNDTHAFTFGALKADDTLGTYTLQMSDGWNTGLAQYKGADLEGSASSVVSQFVWFDQALSTAEVAAIAKTVPEPTTATLSLLALAGLAARRRRK